MRAPKKLVEDIAFISRFSRAQPPSQQQQWLLNLQRDAQTTMGHEICTENELRWAVQRNYANPFSVFIVGMELLAKEVRTETRTWFGLRKRSVWALETASSRVHG